MVAVRPSSHDLYACTPTELVPRLPSYGWVVFSGLPKSGLWKLPPSAFIHACSPRMLPAFGAIPRAFSRTFAASDTVLMGVCCSNWARFPEPEFGLKLACDD